MRQELTWCIAGWCLLAVGASDAAWASRGLVDGGSFFVDATSPAAAMIDELFEKHHREIRIETFAVIPDDQQAKFKQLGSEAFFKGWLVERAKAEHVDGIFILICRQPAMIKVGINEATRKSKFNEADREALWKLIKRRFDKKEFDAGVLDGLKYISDRFEAHGGAAAAHVPPPVTSGNQRSATPPPARTSAPRPVPHAGQPGGGMLSFVVFGLVLFVAFLVIRGLFRAMTGGTGGYGGVGQPMGGGGFGTGFFSGMFGAFAGHALYDAFFRGHSSSGWDNSASASEPYSSFGDGDITRSGGSTDGWSVNDGGSFGDASSGSSDFGGGGDFGGGDFGGGSDF